MSVTSVRDSATARLADLIYEVCPDSRPLFDARAPRCGFEAWFGQPEAAASTQRFRMYPRVAEVQEEVAAGSEALARRAKPLWRVIPARALTPWRMTRFLRLPSQLTLRLRSWWDPEPWIPGVGVL